MRSGRVERPRVLQRQLLELLCCVYLFHHERAVPGGRLSGYDGAQPRTRTGKKYDLLTSGLSRPHLRSASWAR